MENQKKRFEEWEEVDCNDCSHYWDNSCDGVQKAQKRLCTSFKATRSVVIPQEVKWLRTRLKWLVGAFITLGIVQIITLIIILIYYF